MFQETEIIKKEIDGQTILFPSPEQWEVILTDERIGGKIISDHTILYIKDRIGIVNKYEELSFGIDYVDNRRWKPYIILEIQRENQRVFLEKLTCSNCKWSGFSANPYVIDNYTGLPKTANEFDLMKKAKEFPSCACPICKSKLPRPSIWIEY